MMEHQSGSAMRPLGLGATRPTGWLLAQLRRDLETGFAGCLDDLSERISTDLFAHRVGTTSSQFTWWDAETRGNWLWGYLVMAHLSGLEHHKARAEALVTALRATQDADGYLGIYMERDRFNHGDEENGELWAQSRALMVLVAHHELTGDPASLEAARRSADLTVGLYGPQSPYFRTPTTDPDVTGMTHGLNYTDAADRLSELTGSPRYREFATWLFEDFARQAVPFQNDDLAPAIASRRDLPLRGHAAHTAEHLRPLLVARGDDAALLVATFRKLRLQSVPSGALIGDESVHGVPMPDSGYEICTMVEQVWSLAAALRTGGDASVGDWAERLMFNALQGARFADGRALAYLTPDTRLSATIERPDIQAMIQDGVGRYKFSPTHEDVATCCVANSTRVVAHYVSAMWSRTADETGLVASLFGPCVVETQVGGVGVRIEETTSYPFEDTLQFTIVPDRPVRFPLVLRRPAWAGTVHADAPETTESDGWLVVDRTWQAGDTVRLTLTPEIVAVPYATQEVAVQRGPLQFVQAIAHRERPVTAYDQHNQTVPHNQDGVKTYPRAGFADVELLPVDLAALGSYPVLDAAEPDFGLRLARDPDADLDHPWDRTPVRLEGTVTLVPMGCAPLRRAAFTLIT